MVRFISRNGNHLRTHNFLLHQIRAKKRSSLVSNTMARTLRAAPSGLRITIRFLAGATRRAIKRLQQTVVHASKLARPPAADPQPRLVMRGKQMMPAPNFIAGVLIGIANDLWWAVLLSALGWGLVFCFYVTITQSERRRQSIQSITEKGQRLFLGSATMTFYMIEFVTAFTTSFIIGILAFGIKRIFT
jgi:hypothetical protein